MRLHRVTFTCLCLVPLNRKHGGGGETVQSLGPQIAVLGAFQSSGELVAEGRLLAPSHCPARISGRGVRNAAFLRSSLKSVLGSVRFGIHGSNMQYCQETTISSQTPNSSTASRKEVSQPAHRRLSRLTLGSFRVRMPGEHLIYRKTPWKQKQERKSEYL